MANNTDEPSAAAGIKPTPLVTLMSIIHELTWAAVGVEGIIFRGLSVIVHILDSAAVCGLERRKSSFLTERKPT